MFERFTKPARRVVEAAMEVAAEAQAERVRPEHLFLALLEDDDGLAVAVLDSLGAPPERLRAEVGRRRGRYPDGLGDADAEALAAIGIDLDAVLRRIDDGPVRRTRVRRPRFSREAKKALELSLREALALQHHYIGTEHLLLGLVRGGDPVVCDTLAGFDVTAEALRTAVADAVRKAG